MDIKKGIIISTSQYKDKNLICNLLLESEIISFEVISYFNSKKGFTNDIQILNYGEFELYKGPTSYYKLKSCKIEKSLYSNIFENKDNLISYEYIKEIVTKIPPIDYYFKYFKLINLTSEKLINDSKNRIKYLTIFISFYLRFIGYSISNFLELEVNKAVQEYTKKYGEVVTINSSIFNLFSSLYNSLFNKRYLDALDAVSKCDDKLVFIVFGQISLIFSRLSNITINSLNLFKNTLIVG